MLSIQLKHSENTFSIEDFVLNWNCCYSRRVISDTPAVKHKMRNGQREENKINTSSASRGIINNNNSYHHNVNNKKNKKESRRDRDE